MKKVILVLGLTLFASMTFAQEAPKFLRDTYPPCGLQSALEAMSVLNGSNAQLDAKTRELVALGVAAQIPCVYCVYYHTKAARANGATESEIREAVAAAATVRQWSTVLNGMGYDFEAYKAEVGK